MSEITGVLNSLESRINQLIGKIGKLEQQAEVLKRELKDSNAVIQRQASDIENLKSGNESLKMANAMLGSEENKRDTKLKINSLIREIDYCIAQLAD